MNQATLLRDRSRDRNLFQSRLLIALLVVVVEPSMPVWVVCAGRLMLEPSLPLSVTMTVWPPLGATVPPPLGNVGLAGGV